MEWLTAVALPLAGVVGGLIGAWWVRRSSRSADIGVLLNAQLEALYSPHPRQRQAARDIIRGLMASGSLNSEQLLAASTALRHWAAVAWDALESGAAEPVVTEGERRTLEASPPPPPKEGSDA